MKFKTKEFHSEVVGAEVCDTVFECLKLGMEILPDSRGVAVDNIFLGLSSFSSNLRVHIAKAAERGCKFSIIDKKALADLPSMVVIKRDHYQYSAVHTVLVVYNMSKFYHKLLCESFDVPANIMGVTGTNGKTSVVDFTRQLLTYIYGAGVSVGTLGVCLEVKNKIQLLATEDSLTTPSSYSILQAFKELGLNNHAKIDYACLEVSSHSLMQNRLIGLEFKNMAFTSFSQDHLDYHGDLESYFKAKMKIAALTSNLILHSDVFAKIHNASHKKTGYDLVDKNIVIYGEQSFDADVYGVVIKNTIHTDDGIKGMFVFYGKWQGIIEISFPLSTEIELLNALCAILQITFLAGKPSIVKLNEICSFVHKLKSVVGRFQRVATLDFSGNQRAQVFVDYAHNPGGLKTALKQLRKICKGRLWVVFGVGGGRCKGKKASMGNIASLYSDKIIVTDDNPRHEDKEVIKKDIIRGISNKEKLVMSSGDRKNSITKALELLDQGDILLIAGKGHEEYQIIGDKKFPYSGDTKIVEEFIAKSKAC